MKDLKWQIDTSDYFFMETKKWKVVQAENLDYMTTLESNKFQLIYIDPPFNTSKKQQKTKEWDKKIERLEYYDSFGDGIQGYLEFMKPRLRECKRLLKDSGFLAVHLDYNSVHYIKCMLDDIFGEGNIDRGESHFVNEIIIYNWTTKVWDY